MNSLTYYWGFCTKVNKENWKDLPSQNKIKFGIDEAGIFYEADEIIIAVDGSSDTLEWIGDFKFFFEKGFHKDFFSSAEKLLKKIEELLIPNVRVTIVGHSRGGAISLLLGYLLNRENVKVVTFGSPKAATFKGVGLFKKNNLMHTRVVIKGDAVDNLPPVIFGFSHYATSTIKLKSVKGKLNHIAFGEALQCTPEIFV